MRGGSLSILAALTLVACTTGSLGVLPPESGGDVGPLSGSDGLGGGGGDHGSGADGLPPGDFGTGVATAAELATSLGKPARFLIGIAEQDEAAVDGLGVSVDLYYRYLVGLPGEGGWPEWNTDGSYVNIVATKAEGFGAVPMYTLYQMAAWGDGELSGLSDATFMGPYWDAAKLLFQRLAIYDKPAVVHLEPDFWGYAQQACSGNPAALAVRVTQHRAECADLTNDLAGMGRCLIRLARTYAPKARVGFHASRWADDSPTVIANFLLAVGAGDSDFVAMETLDRDAGCFEAATDPDCQRGGDFYWDETNATNPNFTEHLSYAATVSSVTGKPLLWWQTPFGVPSSTPGGTAGHYRDNRVHYIFSHLQQFIAAGGVGVAFGAGADNQTTITTDGGQFKTALTAYMASPVTLP